MHFCPFVIRKATSKIVLLNRCLSSWVTVQFSGWHHSISRGLFCAWFHELIKYSASAGKTINAQWLLLSTGANRVGMNVVNSVHLQRSGVLEVSTKRGSVKESLFAQIAGFCEQKRSTCTYGARDVSSQTVLQFSLFPGGGGRFDHFVPRPEVLCELTNKPHNKFQDVTRKG